MSEQARPAPHRGGLILAFGILGLIFCQIFGILAWVMGNSDLRQMEQGTVDPSGRDLTQAGKICGMISVILLAIVLAVFLILLAAGMGLAFFKR